MRFAQASRERYTCPYLWKGSTFAFTLVRCLDILDRDVRCRSPELGCARGVVISRLPYLLVGSHVMGTG